MPKATSPIVPDDFVVDLGFTTVPAHRIRDLAPLDGTAGVSGSGMVLSDAGIKFRLNRPDGSPVEYSVMVTAKRITPLTPEEETAIAVAKAKSKGDADKRKMDAESERQRLIERARSDGEATASRSLDSAVKLLPVLQQTAAIADRINNR